MSPWLVQELYACMQNLYLHATAFVMTPHHIWQDDKVIMLSLLRLTRPHPTSRSLWHSEWSWVCTELRVYSRHLLWEAGGSHWFSEGHAFHWPLVSHLTPKCFYHFCSEAKWAKRNVYHSGVLGTNAWILQVKNTEREKLSVFPGFW